MTTHPFAEPNVENLSDGGTWLLDLVAAVDHLRRGYRPDLTVWDALTEAIDWYLDTEGARSADATADRLGHRLSLLVQPADTPTAARLQAALRRWVTTMAHRYNNGHHWPHPATRRGFPPPRVSV